MAELARERDHLIVLLRRRHDRLGEADRREVALERRERFGGAVRGRRQDHRRADEEIGERILEARDLAPRHRMAADERPPRARHVRERPQDRRLDAADVDDRRSATERARVRADPRHDGVGRQADEHEVRVRERAGPVAVVEADGRETGLPRRLEEGAADQAQADDRNAFDRAHVTSPHTRRGTRSARPRDPATVPTGGSARSGPSATP